MKEMRSTSFRLERVTSVKLAKSRSWLHLSEAESERVSVYAKLSDLLVRNDNNEGDNVIISYKNKGRKKSTTLGLISKVFSFGKNNNATAAANKDDRTKEKLKMEKNEEEKKKKRSSWLHSSKRRWS